MPHVACYERTHDPGISRTPVHAERLGPRLSRSPCVNTCKSRHESPNRTASTGTQRAYGQDLPEIYSAEFHCAFLRGNDLMLLMQRLESAAPRAHLDIHTDDLDAEVARVERLGAERMQKGANLVGDAGSGRPAVLPAADSPGSLNDENARRWE